MDIYSFLLITHLVGTVLAIGGATMIELHLNKALKDKNVSPDEGSLLTTDYRVVRTGFVISLLSGFGFLLLYKFTGQTFKLYDPVLWAKIFIVVIVSINAILLQAHKISLYWGAALSFVSWWTIGLLGFYLTNNIPFDFFGQYTFVSSFTSVILLFLMSVVIGAAILHFIRKKLNQTV